MDALLKQITSNDPYLDSIILSESDLTDADSCSKLSLALQHNKHAKSLTLYPNNIPKDSVVSLGEAIAQSRISKLFLKAQFRHYSSSKAKELQTKWNQLLQQLRHRKQLDTVSLAFCNTVHVSLLEAVCDLIQHNVVRELVCEDVVDSDDNSSALYIHHVPIEATDRLAQALERTTRLERLVMDTRSSALDEALLGALWKAAPRSLRALSIRLDGWSESYPVGRILPHLKNVKELTIQYKLSRFTSLTQILEGLRKGNGLEILRIVGDSRGDPRYYHLEEFVDMIQACPSLKELVLDTIYQDIGPIFEAALGLLNLKRLEIRNCDHNSFVAVIVLDSDEASMEQSGKLEEISLCEVGEGLGLLEECLRRKPGIRKVSYTGRGIFPPHLLESLVAQCYELDLNYTRFVSLNDPDLFGILAPALRRPSAQLQRLIMGPSLILTSNREPIGDLLGAVNTSETLRELDLKVPLNTEELLHVAQILPQLRLRRIELCSNAFDDAVLEALLQGCAENESLFFFSIEAASPGEMLEKAKEWNRQLAKFTVYRNFVNFAAKTFEGGTDHDALRAQILSLLSRSGREGELYCVLHKMLGLAIGTQRRAGKRDADEETREGGVT